MMPNVTRGTRMGGLMVYLAGRGRANEHTDPHLVAGDDALEEWYSGIELGRDDALAIARHLDRPAKLHDVTVPAGNVWHCSLSLRAEEGQLSDEKWQEIARDFVTRMGFVDDRQSDTLDARELAELSEGGGVATATRTTTGRSDCRWVAVRHGLSKNGNDHIHIAVQLVREDGTKASTHRDFKKAQNVCRDLEAKYGLEGLEGPAVGLATRGYKPGEREADARRRAQALYEKERLTPDGVGPAWSQLSDEERVDRIAVQLRRDQPRQALGRKIRAAAIVARDEGEFVRRLRRDGVLVRPYYAKGSTTDVQGYSVAEKPVAGERPIWYGGGKLGRDLSLARLRGEWPEAKTDEYAAEWNAARKGRRVVGQDAPDAPFDMEQWRRDQRGMESLRSYMRDAEATGDRGTIIRAAHDIAGVLSAWSRERESVPGPLAATAQAYADFAQSYSEPVRVAPPVPGPSMREIAVDIAAIGNPIAERRATVRGAVRLGESLGSLMRAIGLERRSRERLANAQAMYNRIRAAEAEGQRRQAEWRAAYSQIQNPTPRPSIGPNGNEGLER